MLSTKLAETPNLAACQHIEIDEGITLHKPLLPKNQPRLLAPPTPTPRSAFLKMVSKVTKWAPAVKGAAGAGRLGRIEVVVCSRCAETQFMPCGNGVFTAADGKRLRS